ncbi:hypothetical protein, partial [uncultured Bilophila sp.]|uniref:hypothetical protein n=1 Tax=uncultured Bilophila sp. TaxID=529385 RepID=UPI0025E47F28
MRCAQKAFFPARGERAFSFVLFSAKFSLIFLKKLFFTMNGLSISAKNRTIPISTSPKKRTPSAPPPHQSKVFEREGGG